MAQSRAHTGPPAKSTASPSALVLREPKRGRQEGASAFDDTLNSIELALAGRKAEHSLYIKDTQGIT